MLKNNIFKIEFQESKTRRTDGNALSTSDYEMIAIQEFATGASRPSKKEAHQPSTTIERQEVDEQELFSQPELVGFHDYKSARLLARPQAQINQQHNVNGKGSQTITESEDRDFFGEDPNNLDLFDLMPRAFFK